MDDLRIKKGDNFPLRVQLNWDDGTPVVLDSATKVLFNMKKIGSAVVSVSAECTFVDRPNGVVQYEWKATETDVADMYQVEFEVWFGTIKYTIPTVGEISLWIMEDLA